MRSTKKIGVLCSGNGSNLQALIDCQNQGELSGEIGLVVSDRSDCFALQRAEKAGIKTFSFQLSSFSRREAYEKEMIDALEKEECRLIVLAGFMRLLTETFVRHFQGKIINLHPALLPSFPGIHGIRDAFMYGTKITGCTVHFADQGMDTGPIILQTAISIDENDSLQDLEKKIHREEHKILPRAVRLFLEGRISIQGRKVSIKERNKK